jgi:hypothetical protein
MPETPKEKAKADIPADAEYDDAEVARRRDEVVKRMLNTPPQPKASRKGQAAATKTSQKVRVKKSD